MPNVTCSPWPCFTPEEAQAVSRVLLSNRVNYWTGTECRDFEREFAAWVGTEHAVALTNGTLALDVALKALEVGPGDEVVVTPFPTSKAADSLLCEVFCILSAKGKALCV